MSNLPLSARLENYTLRYPEEVLLIQANIGSEQTNGYEPDQIVIFKGFSSSLTRSTAFDPEVPVLPESAELLAIDRLKGPFQPESPTYLERNIKLEDFLARLDELGL